MIFDAKGNLYGATSHGGNTSACAGGCGVVFELAPSAKGQWTETVLYTFDGTDGEEPSGPVTFDTAGDLYGTTAFGGARKGGGTVFQLSPAQGQWTERILHSFAYGTSDGYWPASPVIFDSSGNLYGTTQFGGTKGEEGWGTAFTLAPGGGGQWKETVLRRFDEHKLEGGAFHRDCSLAGLATCTERRRPAASTLAQAGATSVAVSCSGSHRGTAASGSRPTCTHSGGATTGPGRAAASL